MAKTASEYLAEGRKFCYAVFDGPHNDPKRGYRAVAVVEGVKR